MANVLGGAAADTLAGSSERDYIAAGGGNDTIDSGAGNDWIEGGGGLDSFVFNPGCGWDCVGDFKIAEGDRIDLRGWSAIRSTADLTIQADGSDTVVLFGPNDGVRLVGVAAASLTAEQFVFAGTSTGGGSTGGNTGGTTTPPAAPPTGGQTLTGTAARDNLIGGAGNDTITAGGGYDYLEGGAGSDSFVCAAGDSWDYIQDFQAGVGGDVLDLRAWGNIRSLADITISSDAGGTSLVFGPNDGMRLNGVQAGALTSANFLFAGQSGGGTTTPPPQPGGQTLTGTAGRDNLVGGTGNDTITAGAGADYLEGRGGSDTFVAKTGDGWDYVQDFQASAAGDVIDLSGVAGIRGMGDLTFSSDANGTSVVYGAADGLRLNGVAAGTLTAANFKFAEAPAGEADGGTLRWRAPSLNLYATRRLSPSADPNGPDQSVRSLGLSGDGRYLVFSSAADALIPGDTSGDNDIYVKDLVSGGLTQVSTEAGHNHTGTISADGRHVAYVNSTFGWTLGNFSGNASLIVRDLDTNATTVFAGPQIDSPYSNYTYALPTLSGDGSAVAQQRVGYTRMGDSPSLFAVAHVADGTQDVVGDLSSGYAALSEDGRHVASWRLGDGWQVYVTDLDTGTRTLASVTPDGVSLPSRPWSDYYARPTAGSLSISADGRYVAFSGEPPGTVAQWQPYGTKRMFVKDMQTGALTRVDTAADGTPGDAGAETPRLSGDGRYLLFTSAATNLVEGDVDADTDLFLKDLRTGAIVRVNAGLDGATGVRYGVDNGAESALSADGGRIVFKDAAGTLHNVDTAALWANQQATARGSVNLTFAVTAAETERQATVTWGDGQTSTQTIAAGATEVTLQHRYTANGRFEAELALPDGDGTTLRETLAVQVAGIPERLTRVSLAADGSQGNGESRFPVSSADNRFIAFESEANNLVAGDTNGARDIFVKDRLTGALTRVSTAADGGEADGSSRDPSISADGRYVAFISGAPDLVADAPAPGDHLYVKDLLTGAVTLADSAADGSSAPDGSFGWMSGYALAPDGRSVVFGSNAPLVPGDTDENGDLFLKDLRTGAVTALTDGSTQGSGGEDPQFSADGRHLLYRGYAPNPENPDAPVYGLWVRDMQTGTLSRADIAADGTPAENGGISGGISRDGRYVVFQSWSSNLVAGVQSGLFLKDMQTGAVTVVRAMTGSQAAWWEWGTVSPDGRHVAYASSVPGIVPGDTDQNRDVFLFDRESGTTTRLGTATGGVAVGAATKPKFSDDGRYLMFSHNAGNIVPGDTNGTEDVFVYDLLGGGSTLAGDGGRDALFGHVEADVLAGGAGDDFLAGLQGNDSLDGGVGSDLLRGDRGNDTLTGGIGADVFAFGLDCGMDVITDFNPLGDRIQLTAGQDWSVGATSLGDALISFGAADSVTLIGVRPDQVTSGLFITG